MSSIALTPHRRVLADLVSRSALAELTLIVGGAVLMGALAQISFHLGTQSGPRDGSDPRRDARRHVPWLATRVGRDGPVRGRRNRRTAVVRRPREWLRGCELRVPDRVYRRRSCLGLGRFTRCRSSHRPGFRRDGRGRRHRLFVRRHVAEVRPARVRFDGDLLGLTPFLWGELIKSGVAGVALPSSWRLVDRTTKQR